MSAIDDLRSRPGFRATAQTLLVALLVAGYFGHRSTTEDRETAAATSEVVEAVLVDACAANDRKTLRRENLAGPCSLARNGNIDAEIRDRLDQTGDPQQVKQEIAAVDPVTPAAGNVEDAVDAYLRTYDFEVQPRYREAMRDEVERVLSNLGVQPPTRQQIAAAVAAYLVANPPDDGADGVNGTDGADGTPGRGVVNAVLQGCDVQFTYTDGTTTSIGPLCGRDGDDAPPVTDDQVNAAVGRYCEVNDCRGPQGEPGQAGYPESITLADGQECTDPDGDRRYTCSGGGPPIEPVTP